MNRNKSETKKLQLAKAARRNRRIPIFATARTNRKLVFNRYSRNWRRQKLKLKE